jgi:hypothetical protein
VEGVLLARHPGFVSEVSDQHRRRLERAARFIGFGSDLTGPVAGGAIGLVGGPLGVLAGSAVGLMLQKVLASWGAEFEQRHLGPREKARAGAALYWALEDIDRRLEGGEEPRDDDFFEAEGDERPRADELLEAVLVSAQNDHEERKLRHLGWLYSSLVFDKSIKPGDATFIVELASRLTYTQLAIIGLFHESSYRSLPSWERLHPYEWRAHIIAAQLFDLTSQGLLARTDGQPVREYSEANPSELWVGILGCKLYHLMRLEELDADAVGEVYDELEEATKLETPWELVNTLENYVDAFPISEEDIGRCVIRVPLDGRVRAMLPAPGAKVYCWLHGVQFWFRYELAPYYEDVGVLVFEDDGRYAREAFLSHVDLDAILRVASAGAGELTIG